MLRSSWFYQYYKEQKMKQGLLLMLVFGLALSYNFTDYVAQFGRTYATPEETALRQQIFESNYSKILESNSQNLGYTLAPNNFTDRTQDEMKQLRGFKPNEKATAANSSPDFAKSKTQLRVGASDSINWNTSGKVTSVKNQGSCGSCWAFTATTVFESFIAQVDNQNYDLSEEYILECTSGSSCRGGYMSDALLIAKNQGIPSESDYPYRASSSGSYTPSTSGICSTGNTINHKNKFEVYYAYGLTNSEMKAALAIGTVAVAIAASDSQFSSYSSGVLSCPNKKYSSDLDHAVQMIGYDQSNSWIIKNSWGTSWGVGGFGYISQDTNHDCGVLIEAYRLDGLRMVALAILLVVMTIVIA